MFIEIFDYMEGWLIVACLVLLLNEWSLIDEGLWMVLISWNCNEWIMICDFGLEVLTSWLNWNKHCSYTGLSGWKHENSCLKGNVEVAIIHFWFYLEI